MAFDLSSIISEANSLSKQQEGYAGQIAATRASQGELGQSIADNKTKSAELKGDVDTKVALANLQALDLARANATAMGTNAADVNEVITATSAQLKSDLIAYTAASKQAQDLEANSNLLANPMGWLNDLLNGQQVRAVRDETAKRASTTSAMLSNMYTLTDQNTKTQLSLARTMDADSIAKLAEADSLKAASNADKAKLEAQNYVVDGLRALQELGPQEFSRHVQIYNAIQQDQNAADNRQMHKDNMEIMRLRLAKEQGDETATQFVADNVNRALKAQSLPEIPTAVIKKFYGTNTPEGMLFNQLSTVGMLAANKNSAVIGTDPFDAYSLLSMTGGKMPDSTDQSVIDTMHTTAQKVAQEIESARAFTTDAQVTPHGVTAKILGDPKKLGPLQAKMYNTIFNEDIRASDAAFASKPVNFELVHKQYPQLAQTPFGQLVVAPIEQTGVTKSLKDLGELTAAAYASGVISSSDAAKGLADYAQATTGLYNALSGRTAIGAPLVDGNTKVPLYLDTKKMGVLPTAALVLTNASSIPTYSLINKQLRRGVGNITMEVDLTNPTSIATYLAKYRTSKIGQELQNAAGATPIKN